MEFGLSEDQTLLQDSVMRLVSDRVPLEIIRKIANGDDAVHAQVNTDIDGLSLDGLLVTEADGGLDLGVLDAALVQECFGYGVVPSRFLSNTVSAFAVRNVSAELAGGIATGELKFSLALNEVLSCRDGAGASVSDGKVSGQAMMVMDAADSTHSLVWADGGVHVCRPSSSQCLRTIDRTRSFSKTVFDQSYAVDVSSQGAKVFAVACILVAADTLGAAQCMLDKAVAYAGERKQFGRTIGSFQAVKHLCAEMAARLEPARALLWHAAHAIDTDDKDAVVMAALAKAHISDVGTFVARTSTEVHGGMGFTDLVGLHYWFKRIGVNRQILGSPMAMREYAARLQGFAA